MPLVTTNQTHYSTEDIERAVMAFVGSAKRDPRRWKYGKRVQPDFGVRYWSNKDARPVRPRKRGGRDEWATKYVSCYDTRRHTEDKHPSELLRLLADQLETEGRLL